MRDDSITGGVRDYSREDAAKTIESKIINSFDSRYFYEEYLDKSYPYCDFKLVREKDFASCKVMVTNAREVIYMEEFNVSLSTLDDLQLIVDELNLAAFNGINRHVDGLPEGLGMDINILYASGENIRAYDNSLNRLNSEANAVLFNFFEGLLLSMSEDYLVDNS